MERFKRTIAVLENDVAELKQFQTKIQGSTQSKGDVHYCTSSQEFGEYELDELDTFRFSVSCWDATNKIPLYHYALLNPTPELTAYLKTQGKDTARTGAAIPIDPEKFEEYWMEKGVPPFALTIEIRKCLESKPWEFVRLDGGNGNGEFLLDIRPNFYLDIPISFDNTYKISPHVSVYITPLSPHPGFCQVSIHELTTKQVVFRVRYDSIANKNITGLKLHYSVSGIVDPKPQNKWFSV